VEKVERTGKQRKSFVIQRESESSGPQKIDFSVKSGEKQNGEKNATLRIKTLHLESLAVGKVVPDQKGSGGVRNRKVSGQGKTRLV